MSGNEVSLTLAKITALPMSKIPAAVALGVRA
jgi:hypothetical protein